MSTLTEQLVAIAQQARSLPRGTKTAFYDHWAQQLCMSRQTLLRRLKDVAMTDTRKKRSDAGQHSLELAEAQLISTAFLEMMSKHGKERGSFDSVVEMLRADGKIVAGRTNEQTGEFTPLSMSAITRALRSYGLHPDQLAQPAPATPLRSLHPNHCWQVDASISAQFYMDVDGSQAIDPAQYYDGKPENLKKIERRRLWRYVITDHASGALYVEYVLGAETAENLINVFINAMQKRHEHDPFHGVPLIMMTDPGAAMKSARFRNLCRGLGVDLIINQVGNARAKGQVEQAHNLVERMFESRLAIQKANSLDEINQLAWRWMRHFNATRVHTRTKMTRYGCWLQITPDQLRLAPSIETCRELAITAPVTRKVDAYLWVSYDGRKFDVSAVPDVYVGQKLLIVRNPYRENTVQVVVRNAEGREEFHVAERVEKDQFGQAQSGAVIGREYKAQAATAGEIKRQELEQLATGTTSVAEAEAARKAKRRVLADVNPHADTEQFKPTAYIPKRGTELAIEAPQVVTKPLTHVEAAKLLRERLGSLWQGAEQFNWLKKEYPEGVASEQLDAIEAQLRNPRPVLRVVGGE